MRTTRIFTIGTALTCGAALACLAAAPKLDVRTGLWEVTSVGETSGMPPIPAEALARMTPQQRTQFEVQMKAAMEASNKPDVRKVCVTDRTLERGMDLNDRQRATCKRSVLASMASVMDVRMECTGSEKSTGTFHFQALDRQTMHGNFNMVVADGANSMTIKRTIDGKWLGADCGTVKPID